MKLVGEAVREGQFLVSQGSGQEGTVPCLTRIRSGRLCSLFHKDQVSEVMFRVTSIRSGEIGPCLTKVRSGRDSSLSYKPQVGERQFLVSQERV